MSEETQETTPENALIDFDAFLNVDMRVAEIIEVEPIPKSKKLLKLQVSLGEEQGQRQILAGIAGSYSPDVLRGRKIVIVANLKPAKLMGHESQGMLLATNDETGLVTLLNPGANARVGTRVG